MKKNPSDNFFDAPDGPQRLVLGAVAFLAALFFGGSLFFLLTGTFSKVEVLEVRPLPEVPALVCDYHGTLWGLEQARKQVRLALDKLGAPQELEAITVFPESPRNLRAIRIRCLAGYILPQGLAGSLPEGMRLETFRPGQCLVVRVNGSGNYTGLRAFRAAAREAEEKGFKLSDGTRYEVKTSLNQKKQVEHWIQVRN